MGTGEAQMTIKEGIRDKFEDSKGTLIWGKTSTGDYVAVLVDANGKLETT